MSSQMADLPLGFGQRCVGGDVTWKGTQYFLPQLLLHLSASWVPFTSFFCAFCPRVNQPTATISQNKTLFRKNWLLYLRNRTVIKTDFGIGSRAFAMTITDRVV